MAFKEIQDLDADVTTALGGFNKKTGKKNPTQIEGYFLGSKKTPSPKAKSGFAMLYFLQTEQGNVGVWGKTDLDRKMSAVPTGAMIRITQSGSVPTPNGDMYKFKVEVDAENSIEVALTQPRESSVSSAVADEEEVETDLSSDEDSDAIPYTPPVAPKTKVQVPDAAARAKAQALLGSVRNKASA